MEETARSGRDGKQARPAAGEEGVTTITKYHIGSVGGSMTTPATPIRTHERTGGGGGATEDRLADEEARHEVEEGAPARAVGIRGLNQRLGDGGDAVAEHGALRGG